MKGYKNALKLFNNRVFIKRCLCYGNIETGKSGESVAVNSPSFKANKHVYSNVQPWGNVVEFSKYLYDNIVYNSNGVIAINKPYGVALTKPNFKEPSRRNFKKTASLSFVNESRFCLHDAMSYLKTKLNMPELVIVKCPERYTTGVMLLAAGNSISERVRKSYSYARSIKKPYMSYWCVTKGYPQPEMGSEHVGIKLDEMDQDKVAQICEYSKSKTKQGEMKSIHANYRTLKCNKLLSVALVELETTSAKWHFPRVYMIQKGVCILGDTLFSNRITTVLNKTVILNKPSGSKPSLAIDVCKKLSVPLDGDGFSSIPVSLHLMKFHLPKFLKNKQDLIITCPLPEHFQWTCSKLDLLF